MADFLLADILATYLLHSTLVLGLALALVRLPRLRSASARDLLLRVALLAPLGTAAVALVHMSDFSTDRRVTVAAVEGGPGAPPTRSVLPAIAGPNLTPRPLQTLRLPIPGGPLARNLLLLSGVLAVLRFGLAWLTVRRRTTGRVDDPGLLRCMEGLTLPGKSAVKLYWTSFPVPCAVGRDRVLLPRQIGSQLTPDELGAVLAHEYAHLRRRDPLWNLTLSFVAQLLWFQPLNWLVLRAWRNAAEEQCDRWAGGQTAPLALAQALVSLARLRLGRASPSLPLLVSEAAGTTHLTQRIQALIHPQETTMKRSPLILLALAPVLCGLLTPSLTLASGQQPPRIVVLDPGHGYDDPGAVGYANEAEVVLQIALQTRSLLVTRGVKVILTRETSVRPSLQERVRLTPPQAAAYVAIHANLSSDPQAQGVLSFVAPKVAGDQMALRSRRLAEGLERSVSAATGARNLGVSSENLYVLRKSVVPAVLIEVGYVSNPQEGKALQERSYQARIAQGIAAGILESLR